MEINNNIERQKTIQFYVDYRIKKLEKKNDSRMIFKFYYFTLKPTEHLLINAKIDFELPDRLRTTVVTLPSIRTTGLKSYQKNRLCSKRHNSGQSQQLNFYQNFYIRKRHLNWGVYYCQRKWQ